jgi:hypothetical protein
MVLSLHIISRGLDYMLSRVLLQLISFDQRKQSRSELQNLRRLQEYYIMPLTGKLP